MKSSSRLAAGFLLLLVASFAHAQIGPYTRFEGTGTAFSADTKDEQAYTRHGKQINRGWTGKLFRDAQGRTRVEVDGRNAPETEGTIMIFDPVRKVQINLFPKLKVATIHQLSSKYGQPSHPLGWSKSEDAGPKKYEDAGTKEMEGYKVSGTRASTNGKFVSEEWFSADLKATLYSTMDYPWGKSSHKVFNIRPGSPDPSVFEIPEGYEIKDTL